LKAVEVFDRKMMCIQKIFKDSFATLDISVQRNVTIVTYSTSCILGSHRLWKLTTSLLRLR